MCAVFYSDTCNQLSSIFIANDSLYHCLPIRRGIYKCRHLWQHGRVILNVRALDSPATASALGTFWSCHVRRRMDWDAATRDCTYYYSSRHNHMVLVYPCMDYSSFVYRLEIVLEHGH